MGGRTHRGEYQIAISNWFTDGEYLCVEYTHGTVLTGANSAGLKLAVKPGILRYCFTFHMRDGKFDQVHEYINETTFAALIAIYIGWKWKAFR